MTPIHEIYVEGNRNHIYLKREDLLPFSFGGNKVRIAKKFFEDMAATGKGCMVGYGNARSNLSRALANICCSGGVECHIISPADEDGSRLETANSRIGSICNAEFRYCRKEDVAGTVETVLAECRARGKEPYYIYGDKYGYGNEAVPVRAYVEAYEEIRCQGSGMGIEFDYIFLATGTGMTQGGLIAGQRKFGGQERVIGISVARKAKLASSKIRKYVEAYEGAAPNHLQINVLDCYLAGGYGLYNAEICRAIREAMRLNGVPLDVTYTGKAFWGMCDYIRKAEIRDKNILFLHTGGTPLFFDGLKFL